MRALISGTVVDLDENAWSIGGKSGTTLKAFVQCGSPRDAAVGVRVTDRQFGSITVGQKILWPVDVQTFARDNGQAKLTVSLPMDHDPKMDADVFGTSVSA